MEIKTKINILCLVFTILISCQNSINKNSYSQIENLNEIEVFDVDKMLFNGKAKRFFLLKDFETNFGEIDSINFLSEEEDYCHYIFQDSIGNIDLEDKFLYKNGSRFENHKEKVAIDKFRFNNGNFLKYENHNFNSSTTINDLRKIFPNAVNQIGTLNVYGEGKLQVIELREDENNISDGHIKVFFKNGRLYFMHWWSPC